MEEEFILQEYIDNPLLIDHKKFDLRIYLTIVGVEPMVGYIGREGMVRICTEAYEKPNRENRDNTFIHLSNYSINKESEDFNKDLIGGSKRTLSSLFTEMGEEDASMMSATIDEVVSKTIHALKPFISNLCESYLAGSLDKVLSANLFQMIGFDILVDEEGKAWLLEINNNPSLNILFEHGFMDMKTSEPSPVD